MKFQVPQFVEVEDKLFWRLTLKQFIYLAGGAGLSVIIYLSPIPKFFGILLVIPVIAFSLALAFYKINNRPFIVFVEAATKYFLNSKLYIWRKVEEPVVPEKKATEDFSDSFIPKLSNSKLKDMNWTLDTKAADVPQPKVEKPK